ncbi:hypothetical protein BpHYR1_045091 [Brachionus plicatilis]|uniref:Uncharacterized protein n=1 Tax=Brachionus plicatilis TaxID=10195 RepID=A0A3M7T0A1_BRAPC|nr:hypothetical protein BpHYR1_045091 [Brachionus plicatilis]
MDDKSQLALELTRKKIEENRNLLLEKNAELTEISCRLEDVQKQIKHLKSFNTDDVQLESMRYTDNLRVQFQNEQIKFDFFKQVNILNQNFSLSGRQFSNKPTQNLLHCLIDISERAKLPKAHLYQSSPDTATNETIDQFVAKLKNFVYIDENSSEISQAKLDEMCNKIGELKQVQMPTCILFDHKNKSLINSYSTIDERTLILYRHADNFLVLQVNMENVSVVGKAHDIVNNLICEQVLYELCIIKLKERCGSAVGECSMEMLCQALQKFKKDFVENKDQCQKRFLNEINIAKNENVLESLIQSQVTLLVELLTQVDEYTVEHESVKQDIDLFRERFVQRVEIFLFDECEKRKKMAQTKLKMDTSEGHSLENEITAKQNEINKLNSLLSKKNDQLTMKNKEIELKREQLKLLVHSHDKQEKEINDEMEHLKQELIEKEEEMKNSEVNQNNEALRVDELRNEIQNKKFEIDELNSKKKILEKKRDELNNSIEAEIKEKASLQKEKIECQENKKYLEEQLNELKSESSKLQKLIQFTQAVYNQLLTDQSLFKKRADLNRALHSDLSFFELYKYLVNHDELKQFKEPIVERLAKENVYKRCQLLVNCLDKIVAEPVLTSYRDNKNGHFVIELCAININFDEVEPLINRHIEQELEKNELFMLDANKRVLCVKDSTLKMKHLLENSSNQVSNELIKLIQKRMRKKFIIKNSDSLDSKNGHLTSKTMVMQSVNEKKFQTLADLNAKSVCRLLELDFESVKKCLLQTIKIIAGHNVFFNEKKELRQCGVNLAIAAGGDVVLPVGAIIDTSGSAEPVNFENEQAHGYAGTSREDKCCEGEPGVDGHDGFCGENAGHIYIKAANLVQNLDRIGEIRINGGKGGLGQMGGSGQGGGRGQDTGDAQAENLSPCLFSAGFVIAFARMPGLDPETGEFSRIGELSGKGGDAGKTGLGGMGGHAGEFLIKDSNSWIANRQENKELVESSQNLKSLIRKLVDEKKIVCSQGTAGQNGHFQRVKGGKAGTAGTYGRDHI